MRKFLYKAIFSGGFIGYIPLIPGTLGTLEGVGLYLILRHSCKDYLDLSLGIGILFLTVLSILLSNWAARFYGKKDPPCFIIDEIAGFLVAFYMVDLTTSPALFITLAFGLFRFFDIVKPFPIKQVQTLPGGVGIVVDDLIAGLYTNLLLQIITFILSYDKT